MSPLSRGSRACPLPSSIEILLAVLALCAGPVAAQEERAPAADAAGVVAELERFIQGELAAQELTGLSIALCDSDAFTWSAGFGWADRAAGVEAKGDTVYRVASISKLFTATAVMQLCERGELDLDRPVRETTPEFRPDNPFPEKITLRHLLTHHAGLVREPPVGHYFEPGDSLRDLVASLSGVPLVYRPGERIKYSNAGVAVAGFVVQEQVGAPFERHVQTAVLDPLGMRSSTFDDRSDIARRCAKGFMWTMDGRRFPAPTFRLGMTPAANLYTTVEDLVRFARSCMTADVETPRVLKKATIAAMFEPQLDGPDSKIGIGFFRDRLGANLRVGHGGAIYGFASELEILPELGLAVAVATTEDFANGSAERVAEHALKCLLAVLEERPLPPARRPQPIGTERARALAERYGDEQFWIELEERSGELWEIPSDGLPAVYRAPEPDASVLLADGRLISRWGERRLKPRDGGVVRNDRFLPRLADTPPPPAPERFLELIGEYGWDHDVLYVFEDLGKLCCLIEWLARYPLDEIGEPGDGRFRMPGFGMYEGEPVTFTRGAHGKIEAVVVGAVRFPRRAVGPGEGVTFKIEPRFPPERLRAMAREARMPRQRDGLREPDLVELRDVDDTIRFDVRYAGTNNFMGMVFYEAPVVMMQRPAAEALARAQQSLRERGLGLLVFDAYRPWSVTKMFWDATPEDMKQFVANPQQGSRHNRGCAVDLTLCRLDTGEPIRTVSGYDEFTARAYPHYPGGTSAQRWYRALLRRTMEEQGFEVYEWEWWHFDFRDWQRYPVLNVPIR